MESPSQQWIAFPSHFTGSLIGVFTASCLVSPSECLTLSLDHPKNTGTRRYLEGLKSNEKNIQQEKRRKC